MTELSDIVESAALTDGNDIAAGLVYIGKILETHMRILSGIAERRADLDLRMTNIHVQALELTKEMRKPCPRCL